MILKNFWKREKTKTIRERVSQERQNLPRRDVVRESSPQLRTKAENCKFRRSGSSERVNFRELLLNRKNLKGFRKFDFQDSYFIVINLMPVLCKGASVNKPLLRLLTFKTI